jgi:hypothetical protein
MKTNLVANMLAYAHGHVNLILIVLLTFIQLKFSASVEELKSVIVEPPIIALFDIRSKFRLEDADKLLKIFPDVDCFLILDETSEQVKITGMLEEKGFHVRCYYGLHINEIPNGPKDKIVNIVTPVLQ